MNFLYFFLNSRKNALPKLHLALPEVLRSNPRHQPFSILFTLSFLFGFQQITLSQIKQLENYSSSYSGSIQSGPTTSYVKARFVNNTSGNSFSTFNPEINVIASFSDQQYNNSGGISNLKGNFFGGATNDDNKAVTSQTVWRNLNSISNPSNESFTSNPEGASGQGIDTEVNYGFNMFTTVEPLYSDNKDKGGRYYYSKLTLKFNRAVSNPVLHIVGLGATTTITKNHQKYVQGFSTELELDNGKNITLTKLSGSQALKVENNKILNGSTSAIDDKSSNAAASGSIRVTGNNITTLVFKIYLRGDNKGTAWSDEDIFSGDQWLMAFSMNASSISGNVFDDGNALKDSKVNPVPANNGEGTNLDGALHVNLVSGNTIVATSDVAADGAYLFQDIVSSGYPATYSLVLTDDESSKSTSLPDGWVNTGENTGIPSATGSDGTVDGKLSVTLSNATTIVTNVNFGINKIPVSDSKTAVSRPNPQGTNKVAVPALTGTDMEDIEYNGYSKTNTIKITALPSADKGLLYYDNEQVVTNQVILNYDPEKLWVDPSDGSPTVTFRYCHRDAADSYSVPVSVTMPFYVSQIISGNVFDDANGLLGISPNDNKVDGNGVKGSDIDNTMASTQPVYVSLVYDAAVLQTISVSETGSYSFSNKYPAGNYKVVLHNNVDGSANNASPVPNLWVNTGENQGPGQGNDGIANGEIAFRLADGNVQDLNFGINKIPTADVKSQIIAAPAANTFIPLDGTKAAPAISGFDLEDKVLGGPGSKVVITRFPTKGKLYYSDTELQTLNVVISQAFVPSLLKIKLSGGDYTGTDFDYAFVDAAGVQGTSARYQLTWNAPLPVTLTKFTAVKQEQTAALAWSTTSETNSDRFDLQHSTDGNQWRIIGSLSAKGESQVLNSYSFLHLEPSSGQNLYRLKMVDRDGSFAFSRISAVNFEFGNETTVYPNPAVNFVKVKIDGQTNWSQIASARIFNLNGQVVSSYKITSDELDVQALKSGNFIIQITRSNGMISNTRITIKK